MRTSVALCTYNGERFITAQLTSILQQTQPVDEIIVCDDASSDATVAVVEQLAQQYQRRIKLLRNPQNLGAIRSFEKCIKACVGDIVFLSDQDDAWHPDKVDKLMNALAKDSEALAIFSDADLIGDEGQQLEGSLWAKWAFTPELQAKWLSNDFVFTELVSNRNKITGATLAFKRELLPVLLPFALPSGYWHDAWIGLVASGLGGLRFLAEPTISYRIHQQQQVGVTEGASDKKFDHIPYDQFLLKVSKLFPKKAKLIYEKKSAAYHAKNILSRVFNKLARRFY